jgi:hypothetical protein
MSPMKRVLVILLLLLAFNSIAYAAPENASNLSGYSVILFLDDEVLFSQKAINEISTIMKEKFEQAKSIEIYGDAKAKSPAFLELAEKVQIDPVHQHKTRRVSIDALTKYGKDTKSSNVIIITISICNVYFDWNKLRFDMKEQLAVLDVSSPKYVKYMNLYTENTTMIAGTKYLLNNLDKNFNWFSPSRGESDKINDYPIEEKKTSVIVVLPDVILERPELVDIVRKTVSEKFKVKDVPIYIDNNEKTPAFYNLLEKIQDGIFKQSDFIPQKEYFVEYGKETNSDIVIAVVVSILENGTPSFRLKEDIFAVDTKLNKYLTNVVYDTGEIMRRKEGIDKIMNQLQSEFTLPVNRKD